MNHASPRLTAPTRSFTQLLSATRRGARLARLLGVTELRSWGAPRDLTERAEAVVEDRLLDHARVVTGNPAFGRGD